MGTRIVIGGRTYEGAELSVVDAATPLAAGDSSGQVGTINITIPAPDPVMQPDHPIVRLGESILNREKIEVYDTFRGDTTGEIVNVSRSRESGFISLTAVSRLGDLNVYNVQAQPFVGTMEDAFEYYMSLANITSGFRVEDTPERALSAENVVFPGWNGELWYHLKQMTTALDCDLALVAGEIVLRPIRPGAITQGRNFTQSSSSGGGNLAQYVEIYQYNNRYIEDELVYPPGGWTDDVTVITVNAGDTIEQVLQLESSVSSIVPPDMKTFVGRYEVDQSVYTIVGDDGLPIQPAAWEDRGGRLTVEINPDTTSLTVKVTAPTGLPNKDGSEIKVFGVSLADSSGTGKYSTLRIIGTGVSFDKQIRRIPTGVEDSETATEVGVTIDNPFLSEPEQVAIAGVRAARNYNGSALSLDGDVVSIFPGEMAGGEQVFGNVSGRRVWDEPSRRWYRIREATVSKGQISTGAEDDLMHSDIQERFEGMTYQEVQDLYNGLSYREVDLMGVPREQ